MRKAKDALAPIFEERGLKGRSLWIPSRDAGPTRFEVLGIDSQEAQDKTMREIVNYARENGWWTNVGAAEAREILPQKREYPPPIMG